MLSTSNLAKGYRDRVLFDGLTINLNRGDRVGLVGSNGSGKTTLLDILAGEMIPDAGSVSLQRGTIVGYLKQELVRFADKSLLQEVLEGSPEMIALRQTIRSIHEDLASSHPQDHSVLLQRLEQAEDSFESLGGDYRDHEAQEILLGLGFQQADFSRRLDEFSGGWLMRAALGKLLFTKPDVLLLDEPTNHLDLDANLWFEKRLNSFSGSVIVASHDRSFLNRIATIVLAIEPEGIGFHRGNYDEYLVAREQTLRVKQVSAARQDREIQKQMRFVERFRSKARKATQVQSRLKQMEKIERIELPRSTKKVHYSFPRVSRSGVEPVRLNSVSKSYDGNSVYSDLNFGLIRGDRVALVGPNGAGKTTILKMLAGVIPIDKGERRLGHNVISAYYSQDVLEFLNPANTVIDELRNTAFGGSDQNLRHILGGFLFSGDDIEKRVSVLSGGEKARLALAKILAQGSNLLLMDEPTNHLDIPSREVLGDALLDYPGTICFITHDRSLISQVATVIVEIGGDQPVVFSGDYLSYLEHREAILQDGVPHLFNGSSTGGYTETIAGSKTAVEKRSGGPRTPGEKLRRTLIGEIRRLTLRINEIDPELAKCENEISKLEDLFSKPDQIEGSAEFAALGENHQDLKMRAGLLWEEWDTLSSEVNSMNRQLEDVN